MPHHRPVEERLADGRQSPSERLAEAIRAEMADAVERSLEERLDRIEALLSGLQTGSGERTKKA